MTKPNPPSTDESAEPGTPLLLELDRRQNDVLQGLNELDRRILAIIDQLAGKRDAA